MPNILQEVDDVTSSVDIEEAVQKEKKRNREKRCGFLHFLCEEDDGIKLEVPFLLYSSSFCYLKEVQPEKKCV